VPTDVPTSAPTFTPTAPTSAPTFGPASNWNQLSNKCGTSACSIANGGCTITLSDDFAMGLYSGEIGFSSKAITIWGQGNMLDASGGGRLFIGGGADSFLELHDVVLQNGYADSVSGRVLVVVAVVESCSEAVLLQYLAGDMELILLLGLCWWY
jgi:hypothetical protein